MTSASVEDLHNYSHHTSKRELDDSAREEEEEREEEAEAVLSSWRRRPDDIFVDLVNEDRVAAGSIDNIDCHLSPSHSDAVRTARERVLAGISAGVLVIRDEEDKDDGDDRRSLGDNSDDFSINIDFGKKTSCLFTSLLPAPLLLEFSTHVPLQSTEFMK